MRHLVALTTCRYIMGRPQVVACEWNKKMRKNPDKTQNLEAPPLNASQSGSKSPKRFGEGGVFDRMDLKDRCRVFSLVKSEKLIL